VIVELAIGAALIGASSAIARTIWARRNAAAATRRAATPPPPRARGPGLYPGDVLMLAGSELALERASEIEDGTLVRVLEAISREPRFVVQLDAVGDRLVIATPYPRLPEGRVADVVAVESRSLTLVRRGEAVARPVLDDREPLFSGRCRFTVLADRAGKHLIVIEPDGGERLCLLGDLADRRLIDLLPGA
jgi:hypothetical protein